jgi:hypothetical protein
MDMSITMSQIFGHVHITSISDVLTLRTNQKGVNNCVPICLIIVLFMSHLSGFLRGPSGPFVFREFWCGAESYVTYLSQSGGDLLNP